MHDDVETNQFVDSSNEGGASPGEGGGCNDNPPPITKPRQKRSFKSTKAAARAGGKTLDLKIELSEKQIEAATCEEPYILYGGAKGGGKSWLLCLWMFQKALKYKGNKLFFCRRRSVDFTNTTLETWKKAIPASFYKINEQKKKITMTPSGSVIDYGGLDDPLLIQSLNSAEFGHIGGDQAEEFDRDAFAMLRGTLRHRLLDGKFPPYQIMLTANPAQCWLKDEFIRNPKPGFKYIKALPSDNPYLPATYVDNLKEAFAHRPQLLQAYLYGSWDDLSSHNICIQHSWIEGAVNKDVYGLTTKRIVVNDPARFGDDENVIYVMELTGNTYHKVYEQILEHKSTMDTAGRLVAIRKKYQASLIGVDVIGIGSGIVDALSEMKEPVLSINSSSRPTIERNQVKYSNMRSQMIMEAANRFADGLVSLDDDTMLQSQLASYTFDFMSSGKVQVESKDDIKKRLGHSPDRSDCFIMGIHTLDYAIRLDQAEIDEANTDRVGGDHHGENEQGEFIGAQSDFSGYAHAG